MTVYEAPLAEIGFVLRHVGGLGEVAALPGLGEATPDLADTVLAEAARLAERVLAPLNPVGDRTPAARADGGVVTPPGFREAFRAFADGGWCGLSFPPEHGGQGLPRLLATAVGELWASANLAFHNCPLLTQGAVEALLRHGTEEQRRCYAEPLIRGQWTGAMCLTEPQAGSDVGAVRTRAVPDGDRYRLTGGKIYITYGDHDLAENVVHLVLARIEGAPPGSAGLSLFIVPKFLPDADGRPGRRNDWRCVSLEHKLGLHGGPTCTIAYGDGGGAEGFLLGGPSQGMRCMFTMMNNARLAVGLQGLGLAERAWQQALAYAQGRIQGRRGGRPVPIVEHPDVRRMLVTMRARIAAMRALACWTAAWVDRSERHADAAERSRAADRAALLTPMVKAWCTDLAQEIAGDAIQVHGGAGYIEETGAAQHYRDARVLPIYEGTNGIQAMDLVGRKLDMADGELPWRLTAELRAWLPALPVLLAADLAHALDVVERATRMVQDGTADDRTAGAAAYLRMLAATLSAFLLARGAAAATASEGRDWPGLARFFTRALLPPALAGEAQIAAGADLLDPQLLGG